MGAQWDRGGGIQAFIGTSQAQPGFLGLGWGGVRVPDWLRPSPSRAGCWAGAQLHPLAQPQASPICNWWRKKKKGKKKILFFSLFFLLFFFIFPTGGK